MPFSFHPRQEKDLQAYVRYLAQPSRRQTAHLILIQGPTGCGKTFVLTQSAKFFSPKTTRILRNEDVFQIFKLGLSQAGMIKYLYLGNYKFIVLLLDDWVNECQPVEMGKFVKWLDALLSKPAVPITTAVFVTCTDTYHGNASKLYQFLRTPKKTWAKKKTKKLVTDPPPVKRWVKNVVLYAPKDYMLEKYIQSRGVRNRKRIQELTTWCRGDLRQLNLLLIDRLAYLSAKSSAGASTVPRETHIFGLIQTIFEGGARDDDDSSQSSAQHRAHRCVTKARALLTGVTKESNERILDFLLENMYRPTDQSASLGFPDEGRDSDLLTYQSRVAEDLSFLDTIHDSTNAGYVSNGHLDEIVRSMAMHAAHLELDECELDDSVKISPPKQTLAKLRWAQTQCSKAREEVMRSCFWYPGDEAVSAALTRTDPQLYLDFLAGTLSSADRNYGNYSDRLQHISREDMNRVFPPRMLRTIRLANAAAATPASPAKKNPLTPPGQLFMPF